MSELNHSVPPQITVALAWSADDVVREVSITIASGTTIGTLKTSVEFLSKIPAGALNAAAGIGVWGKTRANTYKLRDGDRVEIYMPLKVDPMEQRRQRAR